MKKFLFFICILAYVFSAIIVFGEIYNNQVKNVVLFVLDGCRADYLDLAPMPNLQELKKNGMTYTNAWVGSMINNTPTGHAAMQTGMYPKNNGIIGFYWRDAINEKWIKPSDWNSVINGEQLELMRKNNAIGFIGYLKQKGDFISASVSGHKFYAAEAMGGPYCDIIAFPSWGIESRLTEKQKQYGDWQSLVGYSKSRTAEVAFVKGRSPSKEVLDGIKKKNISKSFGDDESAIEIALSIVKYQNPKVLLVNLPYIDHLGHKAAGGYKKWRQNIGKYMTRVDSLIGKVLDEYKKKGIYDETLFIVTSDHGMITNGKSISVNTIRKKFGKGLISSPIGFKSCSSWFWRINISEEKAIYRCNNLLKYKLPYLRAIYIKHYKNNEYKYEILPACEKTIPEELDLSYRYLLNTHATEYSPNLYMITYEHALFNDVSPRDLMGLHDSPTWRTQHIPMIISGPGIKKNQVSEYPARLIDIAPTILKLFNIEPNNMDGIVLSDALIAIDNDAILKQEMMKKYLGPMVHSLIKASDEDLKLIYPELQDPTRIP
jgi:predicted AlkP superfamily pyrophosphatase or phosphodiesterase